MAIAELIMPKLGESIMEATILRWHKNVGDRVALDETVLDIATDKVDSEVPSTVAGVITELLYRVNDVVPVGAVIARVELASGVATAPVHTTPQQPAYTAPPVQHTYNAPPVQPRAEEQIPYTPQQQAPRASVGNNRFFSPLVLNIANSEGISLSELERIPGPVQMDAFLKEMCCNISLIKNRVKHLHLFRLRNNLFIQRRLFIKHIQVRSRKE